MVKLTDEQRREYDMRNRRIIAAARAGAEYPDLAARFGVNRHRISQIAPVPICVAVMVLS